MITRSAFANEYVPGLFALMVDRFQMKQAKSMWQKLVTVKSSVKAYEENADRSGLDLPTQKGEGAGVNYDTQIAGPKQTWVPSVFALAVRISEEAIDDNLYELGNPGGGDKLNALSLDIGDSLAENLEVEVLGKLLNYLTATTYHTTRMGSSYPMCSATHPRLDGSTYSNLATSSDLTYASFWSAIVAAENQYDHRQKKSFKNVNKIWIPPQLEEKARVVLHSTDDPSTANRAISAYKDSGRSVEICKTPHFTDTDAWVLQMEGDGVIFFWRRKTRFAKDNNFETGDMMIKGDQRFSVEINDPRCFYGNVPS